MAGARQRLPDRRRRTGSSPSACARSATATAASAPTACSRSRPPDEPGYVARLRIFNPDGSEAELSGNGARQALLYLRERGWTRSLTYSIQTLAGEIRATITGEHSCRTDMGRATLRCEGEIEGWRFHHIVIGNPQTAIRVAARDELEALDLAEIGPPIENAELFPNRTNVSFWTELAPDRIRARIFERGVGETQSSGTGACGAAVAHVLRGGDSPVTVELDGGELDGRRRRVAARRPRGLGRARSSRARFS